MFDRFVINTIFVTIKFTLSLKYLDYKEIFCADTICGCLNYGSKRWLLYAGKQCLKNMCIIKHQENDWLKASNKESNYEE